MHPAEKSRESLNGLRSEIRNKVQFLAVDPNPDAHGEDSEMKTSSYTSNAWKGKQVEVTVTWNLNSLTQRPGAVLMSYEDGALEIYSIDQQGNIRFYRPGSKEKELSPKDLTGLNRILEDIKRSNNLPLDSHSIISQ